MSSVPPELRMTYEQQKAYVKAWKARAPIYEEIRMEQARDCDTVRDMRSFNGLCEMAVRDCPPEPTSGLAEFHRRLNNSAVKRMGSTNQSVA
ncbi:MAG: hypothetical protein AAF916_06745 [Planctomycetota bacterium]